MDDPERRRNLCYEKKSILNGDLTLPVFLEENLVEVCQNQREELKAPELDSSFSTFFCPFKITSIQFELVSNC